MIIKIYPSHIENKLGNGDILDLYIDDYTIHGENQIIEFVLSEKHESINTKTINAWVSLTQDKGILKDKQILAEKDLHFDNVTIYKTKIKHCEYSESLGYSILKCNYATLRKNETL